MDVDPRMYEHVDKKMQLPEFWPDGVVYTHTLVLNPELHCVLLDQCVPQPLPKVVIQKLPSDHPALCASSGSLHGLYASCRIHAGSVIGDYAGVVKKRQSAATGFSDNLSAYSVPFKMSGNSEYDIDAQVGCCFKYLLGADS